MMPLKLIIGDKGYSSWSLRPWMVMREFGIPFEDEAIPLLREDSKARLLGYSTPEKSQCSSITGCAFEIASDYQISR
jgi:glutathione S-transferase